MNYETWRSHLFAHPPGSCPVMREHPQEFYEVKPDQAIEFIDRMLIDSQVHKLYSKDQLGNGLRTVYSNSCSDLPFLYTTECSEPRRLIAIARLANLYKRFFERYCTAAVIDIGNDQGDGPMGDFCYMFWDIFVLYPVVSSPASTEAVMKLMKSVLNSRNENCLVSAIHGLGHWAGDVPEAKKILRAWLRKPTTKNPVVLRYANQATTGIVE